MNLTFDQLVDIFEATGLAFRDGHANSTGGCDVPGGICIGIPMDIDITDRLKVAVARINAFNPVTLADFTNALARGGLMYYDTGSHQYENSIKEGCALDDNIEAAYKALFAASTTNPEGT